jgi:hypothetical protein
MHNWLGDARGPVAQTIRSTESDHELETAKSGPVEFRVEGDSEGCRWPAALGQLKRAGFNIENLRP